MVNWTLVGLLSMPMFANAVNGLIAPFFPDVAKAKGISGQLQGCIISAFPVAAALTSPFVGENINNFGRRKFLIFGGCVIVSYRQAFSLFMFANMPQYPYSVFIALGLVSRFLQGIGGGTVGTAALSIIAASFPHRIEVLIGAMQTLNGVGTMLGPLIGSVILKYFGFTALFCMFGALFVFYLPFCYVILPKDILIHHNESSVKLSELLRLKVSHS